MKWSIYIIELASLVLYFIQFTGLCFPNGKHLHISTSLETGWLWTWDLCFSLLSAGIKGMYHHAWLPYKYTHTSLCGGLFGRISCVQAGPGGWSQIPDPLASTSQVLVSQACAATAVSCSAGVGTTPLVLLHTDFWQLLIVGHSKWFCGKLAVLSVSALSLQWQN